MEVTERKVSEEQGGFRKGRDQIFAMKMLVKEYLGKDKKLYAAFIHLEKAYDRVDREALWSVLNVYDVGRQLLKVIQAFYRGKCMCEGGRGVQWEFCGGGGSEAGVCDVTIVV